MSTKCEVSNKVFSTKGNLVAHKRTHTREKPYECDVCNKRFSQSGDLVVHKLKEGTLETNLMNVMFATKDFRGQTT
jgi:uncharacterized Zn-finger protein